MPDILIADLTACTIERQYADMRHYGRGLACELLKTHTPAFCPRLSPQNVFVIVPGLLTGTMTPCATRAVVAARGDGASGLAISSITGDLPQKLASLNVAGIVIKGKSLEGNAVLYIDENEVRICSMPELQGLSCGEIVESIRSRLGENCAIAGCGPAADMALPLSGLFTTYPEGTPRYTCPRSSFGDVPGSKGLRAIIVKGSAYFGAPCVDKPNLQFAGKELAQCIINDPVCGSALPGLGSITLLHLLKNKNAIPEIPKASALSWKSGDGRRINRCCAPMCVIGCLNRHSRGSHVYSAPEEAEVRAALGKCFDSVLSEETLDRVACKLAARGFELGLNTTEFVNAAALYMELSDVAPSEAALRALLEEVANGSVKGRLLGGGTVAICRLFGDNEAVQARMTRPATQKERDFTLEMVRVCPGIDGVDDLDLLYRQIFLMENLGLCIFSSFALLNRADTMELLARLYTYRTGIPTGVEELLAYARDCLKEEEALCRSGLEVGVQKSIPEFVKVLYRYFSK